MASCSPVSFCSSQTRATSCQHLVFCRSWLVQLTATVVQLHAAIEGHGYDDRRIGGNSARRARERGSDTRGRRVVLGGRGAHRCGGSRGRGADGRRGRCRGWWAASAGIVAGTLGREKLGLVVTVCGPCWQTSGGGDNALGEGCAEGGRLGGLRLDEAGAGVCLGVETT